jgi:hypothetical protein
MWMWVPNHLPYVGVGFRKSCYRIIRAKTLAQNKDNFLWPKLSRINHHVMRRGRCGDIFIFMPGAYKKFCRLLWHPIYTNEIKFSHSEES